MTKPIAIPLSQQASGPVDAMDTSSPAQKKEKELDTQIQKHFGNLLKAAYGDVLSAPIPDRFIQLLEKLEKAEPNAKKP